MNFIGKHKSCYIQLSPDIKQNINTRKKKRRDNITLLDFVQRDAAKKS